MDKLPLDPEIELFKWGPVAGKAYLNSDFVDHMYPQMPAPYEAYGFPKALFIFKGEQMLWANEFPEVWERGKRAFENIFLDESARAKFRTVWDRRIDALSRFEKGISTENLAILDDASYTETWRKFHSLLSEFWIPGIVMELANYGSDEYLKEKLRPFISDEHELAAVLGTLAEAEVMTFFQEEEMALAETSDIEAHRRDYFWLHNSYSKVEVLPTSFFEERKRALDTDVRKTYESQIAATHERKTRIQERYSLSEEIMRIGNALWITLMWQDERKKYILQSLHYKKIFLSGAASRIGESYESLLSLTSKEAPHLLENPDLVATAYGRGSLFGFYLSEAGTQELSPAIVSRYWGIYAEPVVDRDVESFKGTVVSKGTESLVTGRVRIVLNAYQGTAFAGGDILVAPMTSPEYIFLMKRAAAIVTDTGGLTSHAAVVSRELQKLCVVNTKVATHVLKEGDMVEVDAEKGIVKILGRAV